MSQTFDIGKSITVSILLITIVKMTYRNPRMDNQLLKGNTNKDKYELTPLIPKIREVLLNVYQLNYLLIDNMKDRTFENTDPIAELKRDHPEILQRVLQGTNIYDSIPTASKPNS
jgi:hypothetical protein